MGKNDENEQNFKIWTSGCFSARKMLIFEYHMSKVKFFSKSAKNEENEQNFEISTSGCFSAQKMLNFEYHMSKVKFFSKIGEKRLFRFRKKKFRFSKKKFFYFFRLVETKILSHHTPLYLNVYGQAQQKCKSDPLVKR